jgi:hypothetical protein
MSLLFWSMAGAYFNVIYSLFVSGNFSSFLVKIWFETTPKAVQPLVKKTNNLMLTKSHRGLSKAVVFVHKKHPSNSGIGCITAHIPPVCLAAKREE